MNYLISIVVGIFIGIFPNHLLTSKLESDKNKVRILATFLLDVIKGLLIVVLIKFLFEYNFLNIILALIFGTLTHSFFQEFKFKRRESLTLALSGLVLVVPSLILIWLFIWIISYAYKRSNDFSLPSATFLTGLLAVTSANIFNNDYWYTDPVASSDKEFVILIGLLFIVIVNSQMDRIKSYFFKGKQREIK